MNIMKKLIIVEHRAHEFANRLLSDISIYAYALEIGARVIDLSFFENNRILGWLHALCAWGIDKFSRGTSGLWALGGPKVLPPSDTLPPALEAQNTLYFFGWLFINPVGLEKYRLQILKAFAPRKSLQRKIDAILTSLPQHRVRIGVSLRLLPFKGFGDGEFLVPPERVREIVGEYLHEKNLRAQDVVLVIACDQAPPSEIFEGYTTVVSHESPEMSLYLLSKCNVVVGTNTTLSNTAAWFGSIPHIVSKKEPIDWSYYHGKETYFENKYANFMQ